jgi:predicted small metal-binding protein
MTYTFACKDLGMDCSFVTHGSSVAEVKAAAIDHARKVHADMLKSMPKEQAAGLDKMVEKVIKTTA